ncbi:hypothetical protein Tco_1008724 [Tanacetum coccineum]
MVACLAKTEGNSDFHKIVDFLTSSSIHHALSINATVDSKAVVVTEASIRSSLWGEEKNYHATTQDSRDSLEGTDVNEGDQVQTPHDSPLLEVSALKFRIKKLENKCKLSISHHRAWLKSVKRLSMKKRFGQKESVSKQGRKKSKPESTLDDSTVFDNQDADHVMEYMKTEEAIDEGRQSEDSAVKPRTPPIKTSIFKDEDITIAQTLIKMKDEKAKEKGVSFKVVEDSLRPIRSTLTLKPLPTIDPKDKGKSVLEEPEPAKKMIRHDFDAAQIARDAKIARQLQVDLQAKVERERHREEKASKAAIAEMYDEVQAGIDADALFAAKL